ncbi:MAG TPA: MBL fold metallo-hydrolase [Steroidobacteraceae bacterium]|nr:MBL fold metallo-hydrolase [Steroidobacteraceae bacterium]
MGARPFRCGLEELGSGLYAWMQPDGGWGWSNAGLVRDGNDSLLVDTLFDEPLTAMMLQAFERATGIAPGRIRLLVNTHANGDHTHGNALVPNAEVIASAAAAREMAEYPPALVAKLKAGGAAGALGEAGTYFAEIFAPFDFAGARGRAPTRTFEKRLDLTVGDKAVELHMLGPAHTAGDVLVWVPHDRAAFTGDLLFVDVTPIMWAGPVGNWLAACDRILALGAKHIVPGHGPMTDAAGVRRLQQYLRWVDGEARRRFDAAMPMEEAIFDIALGEYRNWIDAERLAVNVASLYREYAGDDSGPDVVAMFGLMAKLRRRI